MHECHHRHAACVHEQLIRVTKSAKTATQHLCNAASPESSSCRDVSVNVMRSGTPVALENFLIHFLQCYATHHHVPEHYMSA